RSGAFDVVVYDPPHIPNQGRDRSKDFNIRFGLGARTAKENGYTFAHTYPAFMGEAWRVLIDEGGLMCKITDYVHNDRYQWAHVHLIHAGQGAGFTACDCIEPVRIISSRTIRALVGLPPAPGPFPIRVGACSPGAAGCGSGISRPSHRNGRERGFPHPE